MRVIYQHKPTLARAWKVPPWGQTAEEPVPDWLSRRMASAEVRVNATGGLTAQYVWGTRGCGPGDYIILTETDEIEFCASGDFPDRYEAAKPAA